MPRSASNSRQRRPTGLVLGLLVVFIVATIGFFVAGASNDDTATGVKARSSPAAAPATEATTTTTNRPQLDYAVKQGDTLTAIARYFRISTRVILDANQIANPDSLVVGQVLVIPAARESGS